MYKVEFSKRARRELADSYAWYEDQQYGLGDRFEEAVFERAVSAARNPEMYAANQKNYRQIQLKKFPFVLIFKIREEAQAMLVTSVFHTKRNPANKYK